MTSREWLLAGVTFVAAFLIVFTWPARSHELWINKERRHNAANEWCCNSFDCKPVKATAVKGGYQIEGGEFVPNADAAMAGAGGDDDYWACRRPDKSIRCFFFPPPGT